MRHEHLEDPQVGVLKEHIMSRNSLWIAIVVAAACAGFLLGYAVCSYTGAKEPVGAPPAAEQRPAAGGYGP